MIDTILQASRSDTRLAVLVDEAREYAQIYLLTRDRKKGCEGTGEFMTLREEFRDAVDKMFRYCREKNHFTGACDYDIDTVAVLFMKKKQE